MKTHLTPWHTPSNSEWRTRRWCIDSRQ